MLQFFTVPTSTDLVASVGTWTGAFIPSLLVVVGIVIGLAAAGMFSSLLISKAIGSIKKVTGRGRRR